MLNASHTFTVPGNYIVAVRVEDDDGGFADLTFVVHVLPSLLNPLYLPVVRR